ncbi:hypothetical protein [Virgisporangium aurantiacum]|uniref:Uncharacterized protein n=1 Tax=Virgisporangium aurantiacum TaxID=175570 RepID=A0A8J3ZMH9_9ACTN|nr:hypothetical protein [Virgisporangium aurantiacum]GIJ64298.1 hypothetical protein Vau01_118140 [Virgisporangium aurantiacum]
MAHPRRAALAARLADRLGRQTSVVFDPEPDGEPNPLRCAVRAWQRCPPGSTHHLVVQDDVEPSSWLWELADAAVDRFPDAVLALYVNANSFNGDAARVAMLAGHTWLPPFRYEYFPTLAVVMPCRTAHEFAAWSGPRVPVERDDDQALARFLRSRPDPALLRVPALVEHGRHASLAGWGHQGIRRSVSFQADPPGSDPELELAALPALPRFVDGRSSLVVFGDRGDRPPRVLPDDEHLSFVDMTRLGVPRLATVLFAGVTDPGGPPTGRLRLVRQLTLAGYSLGRVLAAAGADPVTALRRTDRRDAAMRSYIEAGLAGTGLLDRWSGQLDALAEGVWTAVAAGLRGHPSTDAAERHPDLVPDALRLL